VGPLMEILQDVREFLKRLRVEFPGLFEPPKKSAAALLNGKPTDQERARELITLRVGHWAGLIGVGYRRISIKAQRTRWGSCSRLGHLNFNWRLILAPQEVLDYVVIHELCHLIEMNHSKQFWKHVSQWCPEHKERRRWLKENECRLLDCPRPHR